MPRIIDHCPAQLNWFRSFEIVHTYWTHLVFEKNRNYFTSKWISRALYGPNVVTRLSIMVSILSFNVESKARMVQKKYKHTHMLELGTLHISERCEEHRWKKICVFIHIQWWRYSTDDERHPTMNASAHHWKDPLICVIICSQCTRFLLFVLSISLSFVIRS